MVLRKAEMEAKAIFPTGYRQGTGESKYGFTNHLVFWTVNFLIGFLPLRAVFTRTFW